MGVVVEKSKKAKKQNHSFPTGVCANSVRSIVIHTEHAYNTKNMVKRKSSGISSCPVKQPLAKIFMC